MFLNPGALIVCTLARAAEDFVAVKYKGLFIVSVYLSPNTRIEAFADSLDDLDGYIETV